MKTTLLITMSVTPFVKPSRNCLICMWMVFDIRIGKVTIVKWVIFPFIYRCVSEPVLTKIVEISSIGFSRLLNLWLVVT